MLQFNLDQLTNVSHDFYNLTKLSIVLFDEQFRVLFYPTSHTPFCSEVRRSKALKKECEKCDRMGLCNSKEKRELYIYQCHMGLTEAVVPISQNNVIIGYLMLGQVLESNGKEAVLRAIDALPEGSTTRREVLLAELEKMQPISHQSLFSAAHIMEMLTYYLWVTNIINIPESTLGEQLNHYIMENLSSPDLDIGVLCKHFFVSRSHLYKFSVQKFGMSITEYIRMCRIREAKTLLQNSETPIYSIAESCGFRTPTYFTRVFFESVGMRPKEFRKMKKS